MILHKIKSNQKQFNYSNQSSKCNFLSVYKSLSLISVLKNESILGLLVIEQK